MDVGAALAVLGPGQEAAAVAAARARQLRVLADEVRQVGRSIGATTGVDWRSAAAEAFRESASTLVATSTELAARLDLAADVLDRHAVTVRGRLDQVEDFVRRAPDRVRDLGGPLARRIADELGPVLPGG